MKKLILMTAMFMAAGAWAVECEQKPKEMLELTYMSKYELHGEYCKANYFKNSALEMSAFQLNLDKAGEYIEKSKSCNTYSDKILRVANKDHQVTYFQCKGMSPIGEYYLNQECNMVILKGDKC
ncbi:hypothetical protein OAM74_03090 [Gammaproteobacteria bacterium]|nr:hypothetical protein [Gammaproteobacteria bacterium]